jgi:surface protein
MKVMFYGTKVFNQPLNNWDVSNVTNMKGMFREARAFKDQNLSSWDVGNVPSDKHDNFMEKSGNGNTQPSWKP